MNLSLMQDSPHLMNFMFREIFEHYCKFDNDISFNLITE